LTGVIGVLRGDEPFSPWIIGTPGSVRLLLHNGCTLEEDFALTHEMEDAVLTVWLHVDILVAGAMLYCDEPALDPPWFMAMWFVIAS
jgi:hypothetical protein